MRTVQLSLVAAMLAALLLAPAAAQADAYGSLPVRVRPLKPVAIDTLTVTFTAGRLKPDERYQVSFGVSDDVHCTAGYTVQLRPQKPGRRVRVHLTPSSGYATGRVVWSGGAVGHADDPTRFCAGPDRIVVMAVSQDGKIRNLGSRRVTITKDAGYPRPAETPARIDVTEGSIAVKAAGRPDRTMPIGGAMRGAIPERIVLNSDIAIRSITGGLVFKSLIPDPLCAGERYAPDLSVVPGSASSLVLKQSGDATLTLQLVADPVSLAGCAITAGQGPTTLTLTGRVGDGGLTKLALNGTVAGVPIAAGVTGGVTVSLVLNVDLSGRP